MNYNLETVGANPIKRNFGESKVKILFKIKNNLEFDPLIFHGINIIPILSNLIKNTPANNWTEFLEIILNSMEESNSKAIDSNHINANTLLEVTQLESFNSEDNQSDNNSFLNNIPQPSSYNYSKFDELPLLNESEDEEYSDNEDEEITFDYLEDFKLNFVYHFENELFQDAIKLQNLYEPTITVTENDYYKYAKLLEFENYHTLIKSDKKISTIVSKANNSYYQSLIKEIEDYEYANVPISLLHEIIINIDPNTDLSLQKHNLELCENHFLSIVKNSKLPLFLKIYEAQLQDGYKKFEHNFIVDKNAAQEALKYTLDNIASIVNNIIQQEEQTIKKIHTNRLFLNFKNDYHTLIPSIKCFFENSTVLKNYFIDFHNIVDEHKSGRGNHKPFLPAGMCHYDRKIYMNTTNWSSYIRFGKSWASLSTRNIFLHELGHAIDYSYKHFNKILPSINLQGNFISNNYIFTKFTRMSYFCSRKYTRKQYENLMYYIHPKIKLKKQIIKYDWESTNKELFAESFAIISNWLINGFGKEDTFIVDSIKSKQRLKIKTFMPILKYLLKNIDWNYLGVNKLHLRKRKTMIKLFLEKIDKLPIILKSSKSRNQSYKVDSFKKPTLNKLIKK